MLWSFAAVLLIGGMAFAQGTVRIDRWAIGGGGPSTGGNVTINGTLCQAVGGHSSGRNVSLGSGFLGGGRSGWSTYLPTVLRSEPTTEANLYVTNGTNGLVLHYSVHNTPEGTITCTNIPAGETVLCGSFTPGTYLVSVDTVECGDSSGQRVFSAGSVTRIVSCQ